jgi:hypothetical protein
MKYIYTTIKLPAWLNEEQLKEIHSEIFLGLIGKFPFIPGEIQGSGDEVVIPKNKAIIEIRDDLENKKDIKEFITNCISEQLQKYNNLTLGSPAKKQRRGLVEKNLEMEIPLSDMLAEKLSKKPGFIVAEVSELKNEINHILMVEGISSNVKWDNGRSVYTFNPNNTNAKDVMGIIEEATSQYVSRVVAAKIFIAQVTRSTDSAKQATSMMAAEINRYNAELEKTETNPTKRQSEVKKYIEEIGKQCRQNEHFKNAANKPQIKSKGAIIFSHGIGYKEMTAAHKESKQKEMDEHKILENIYSSNQTIFKKEYKGAADALKTVAYHTHNIELKSHEK